MRSGAGAVSLAVLAMALLAGVWTGASVRAEEAPQPAPQTAPAPQASPSPEATPAPQISPEPQPAPQAAAPATHPDCDVPDYLLTTESALPKVADAVKNRHPLDILVVGSRSSTISASEASAYPARFQAILKERFPALQVNLSVELLPKKTSEEVDAGLVKLMEDKKPSLVIWQTGTVDAMRSIDPDDFRSAVDEGVAAMQKAGTDVVLMNLQYSPRTESMISSSPYLDNMRVVAQQYGVPLFDRFAIMRQWNDSGDFDFFASHGLNLARQVHDCIGRALAKFVIDAAHLDAAQQN
jgi:hypothetical protein